MLDQSSSTYVMYIVLIALLFIFLLVVVMLIKKKRVEMPQRSITGGSISVFFDMNGNVTVIPYIKDKYGAGRAIDKPQFLDRPYNHEQLGAVVRVGMELCLEGVPGTASSLMKQLGFLDWKEFSKGRRNIAVHFKEGKGLIFNTTRRSFEGAYQFNHPGLEAVKDAGISDMELGQTLLLLLPRCR